MRVARGTDRHGRTGGSVSEWDQTVDVLVAGTGAAGLTAAVTAADAGLHTLVVESSDSWGGTTQLSEGALWMPTNPLMGQYGIRDSVDDALAYLQATLDDAGPASSPQRRRAFVEAVREVVALLQRQGVQFTIAKDHPDHHADRPGGKIGRTIEVQPFDARSLGVWVTRSRARQAQPVPLRSDEVGQLMRAWSSPSGFARGARVLGRTVASLAQGQRLVGMGSALVGSLMAVVRRQGTQVRLSTPLSGLVTQDGAVLGATVTRPDGTTARIRANAGVVLAAGGFAQNRQWRQRYHGIMGYSGAADGDQGSAIRIAESVGAQLSLMEEAWWGAAVPSADPEGKARFVHSERSLPFSIVVDSAGDRYTNESANHSDFGHAMLERDRTVPAIPSWLLLDARHRRRYAFPALLTGSRKLREAGIVHKAQTIEELAGQLGMEPVRLRSTVERFNAFAREGVDHDFGRGSGIFDNYYGDPGVRPNPNLGPLERPPFTAVQLVPGDLGTKGGVLTDAQARVLDESGVPIEGLYAAGSTAASVMDAGSPGLGSATAPAVVFGYCAARHAATRKTPAVTG